LAGSGATNCGRLQSQSPVEMQSASGCATKAAQSKQPFYVSYELPGLTVAVAGNADGKLYAVQSDTKVGQPGTSADVKTAPCPSELRVAASGRVTCVPPGAMGIGSSGGNPHAGVPPASGANPHGGAMPPASGANPHGGAVPPPKP
jgi:hypothetical protein